MTEHIHKAYGLEKDYFILRNRDVQRTDLSYEAAGMLAYIISLPHDWVLHISTLERPSAKREKVHRIVKELVSHGYLSLVKSQDELGRFDGSHYEAFAIPEANPYHNRDTENPLVGETESRVNQPLQSKDSKKEKKETIARERDRLFDGVSLLCFGINAEDEKQAPVLKANKGRIGKITAFLKEVHCSPEKLWAFKKHYCLQYPDTSFPNDLAKFSKHYNDFAAAPVSSYSPAQAAAVIYEEISEVEQSASLALLQAKRKDFSNGKSN